MTVLVADRSVADRPVADGAGGTEGGRGRRRAGGAAWVLVVLAVIVIGVVVAGSTSKSSASYSPTSTSSDGTKALALLLRQEGADLRIGTELPPDGGVALVVQDNLTVGGRREVTDWVKRGGTLVVTDPGSALFGTSPAEGSSPNSEVKAADPLPADCDAPWADGVGEIDTDGAILLARPDGADAACFGGDGDWFAVSVPTGRGAIVSLASPDLWTNKYLGDDDNSVLAANLLVPRTGTDVAWLTGSPSSTGAGHQGLLDLIPDRVDELIIGGLIAVLVSAFWRGRRLGRPVVEAVPVVIPGSELVGAVGQLMSRHGQRDHATRVLRDGLLQEAAGRLNVRSGSQEEDVVARLAERTGRPPDQLARILYGPVPDDDAGLVELAGSIEQVRQEVRSGGR